METNEVVLTVKRDKVGEFEAGFQAHELPIWQGLQRPAGVLVRPSKNQMDISTRPVESMPEYLIVAVFADGEGHHLHDERPTTHLRWWPTRL